MLGQRGPSVAEQGVQRVRRGRALRRLPGVRLPAAWFAARKHPQPRVPVLEERIGVGDRAVGVPVQHEQRLAPLAQRHQLGAVAGRGGAEHVEQYRRVLGVVGSDPPGDPHPAVVADRRRPQRRVGHGRPDVHVDDRAERLEHRAPRGTARRRTPNIAQCASSEAGARPQPNGRYHPEHPRAARASSTGVCAASDGARFPSAGTGRSPSPSRTTSTTGSRSSSRRGWVSP